MINVFTRSIPRRIQASLTGIYLVTYIATALVVYSGARSSVLEANTAALTQLADLKYQQIADTVGVLSNNLTAWSELEVMDDLASRDIDKRVARTVEDLKRLYALEGNIYAFDVADRMLAATSKAETGPAPHLPDGWKAADHGLTFIDRGVDPISGGDVITLAVPVYGSFDKSFRIGTLVATYPWNAVESRLFAHEGGTILVQGRDRLLSADAVGRAYFQAHVAAPSAGTILGQSQARPGPVSEWRVIILQDLTRAFAPLRRIAVALLLLGLGLAIPIAILGHWLSHLLTAPIANLTRTVREISDTDNLGMRVEVSGSDELGTLARSFNRMTDNLERARRDREQVVEELAGLNQTLEIKITERTRALETAIATQQRLIGDISHEIKSPLARLSVALGLARRVPAAETPKQFDRMEKEIHCIAALAGELLTLARLSNAGPPPAFAHVALGEIIAQVVEDAVYESPMRASDISLHIRTPATSIHGNRELLRRSIENVVRNAVFYTGVGTPIDIVLEETADRKFALTVRDNGPGVPSQALEHLFEPFYRVDEARARETGGSGIGLAICKRAIELHGGIVRARNNTPHGLIIEIELPPATL